MGQKVEIESQELAERAAKEAEQSGQTFGQLTTQAIERELARRFLERTRREGLKRRGNMSDEEVDDAVDTAVHSWRSEHRGR